MLLFAHEDAVENNTNQIQKEEKEASRIKDKIAVTLQNFEKH